MKKISKIVVAITLSLFIGQSFATVIMSCEITGSHNSNPTSAASDRVMSTDAHPEHKGSHTIASEASLESQTDQSNCDSEQHSCQCTFGSCSALFLPTDGYHVEYLQGYQLSQIHNSFYSFQLSSLFRPPISA